MKFYSNTDFNEASIGSIPKEWQLLSLRDFAKVKGGKRIPKGAKLVNSKTPFPYLRVVDFKNGTVDTSNIQYLPPETHEKIKRYTISSNDVYISIAGTIGLVGLVPHELDEANLTENAAKLRDLRNVTKEFLVYILGSRYVRNQIEAFVGKGTQPKLALFRIEKLKVPLPPVPEQRRIVEVLSVVDLAIGKVDEVIAKTERLKEGLMQELLTKGIGHKEFKDTKIGKMPKQWQATELRRVVQDDSDIVAGPFGSNLKVCDYKPDGVPIIRLQNIERNRFVDKDIKHISSEKAEQLKYHSYQPGDIVLAKLGDPIGKTCIVPSFMKAGVVVADVVRIRPSPKKALTLFVEYALNSSVCFNQLRRETIGSTRPRVNISQIRNLRIPLPPLDEQQKIAEILSIVDKKLELQITEKAKLRRIKLGLMDLLLSGKVRVKVAD